MATSTDTPVKKTVKPRKKIVADMHGISTTTDCMDTCSRGICGNSMHKVRGILVLLLLVANIVSIWCVRQTIIGLETMKVGGEENYEKMKIIMQSDAYKQNYTQQLDMMMMQMQNPQAGANIPTDTTSTSGSEGSDTSLPLNEAEENSDM